MDTIKLPSIKGLQWVMTGKDVGNLDPRFPSFSPVTSRKLISRLPHPIDTTVALAAQGGIRLTDLTRISSTESALACDALITTTTRQALLLFPADCIPLVLFHKRLHTLALVHIGRHAADQQLARNVIDYLWVEHRIPPSELHGLVGPSIKKESYTFTSLPGTLRHNKWRQFVEKKQGLYHVDLVGYLLAELLVAGMPATAIAIAPPDTGADPKYFSHHRHHLHPKEVAGRNGFAVSML